MRITRETLIRIARETAQARMFNDPDLIAAYLIGSLLTDEPFLGGTTDIDLVLVHAHTTPLRREIVKLPNDFHLDITYRARQEYDPPRELRINPWLGYEIYDPMLLYEKEHFFEFVQAGVRAGFSFHQPALVIQRSLRLHKHGRKIWTDLQDSGTKPKPNQVGKYLKSIYHAANAIAELNGPPLPERRLLLVFPKRAEAIDHPSLTAGLLGLLGAPALDTESLASWLPEWEISYLAAAENPQRDPRIHPARMPYYYKAFEAMLGSEYPIAMLWPLMHTWTLAATVLPDDKNTAWEKACTKLGLGTVDFSTRIQGLDHYFDEIEELLEKMAAAHGININEFP